MSRNWLRLEFKSERCAGGAARDNQSGSAVEDSPPVERPTPTAEESHPAGEGNTRCGAHEVRQRTAGEVNQRAAMTQENYDAKTKYANATHEIEILMSSVSGGTRKGYRRSWKHWLMFCQ